MPFDASLPPWGPIKGLATRMLMIFLIKLRTSDNVCEQSQEVLAGCMDRSEEIVRQCAIALESLGLIRRESASRSAEGMFGGKRYRLLDVERVTMLIAYFDPRELPSQDLLNSRSGKPGIKGQANESPSQETSYGPYKESRSRSRASQSSIYHSLPDNHSIEDEELAEQVAEALACCGEGTSGVDTHWLTESLAHHIPIALEKGFSFEKEILPCIRFRTRYKRSKPLNRFDVTFREDLPAWRAERLGRLAKRKRPRGVDGVQSSTHRSQQSGAASPGEMLDRLIERHGNLDEGSRREQQIVRFRRVIEAFDSGQEAEITSLRFELPPAWRDLSGAELTEALRPIIDTYREDLKQLLLK